MRFARRTVANQKIEICQCEVEAKERSGARVCIFMAIERFTPADRILLLFVLWQIAFTTMSRPKLHMDMAFPSAA